MNQIFSSTVLEPWNRRGEETIMRDWPEVYTTYKGKKLKKKKNNKWAR